MKSACFSTSSMLCARRTPECSRHAASTVISGSNPIAFMPSLIAVSATRLPMAPKPMMPSVRCGSSTPANCFLPSSTRASRSGAAASRPATYPSAGPTLRAAIRSAASTSSFTALAFAPGALNTGTPRGRHRGHRDVVGAHAGASDRLDARRDRHVVHVVRAHEDRIGMIAGLADRVPRAGEPVQPVARDLVERQDLVSRRAHPRVRSNSRIQSTSACTPSIGIAL